MNVERSTPLKVFILAGVVFLALALVSGQGIFLLLSLWMVGSALFYLIRAY